MSSKIKHIQHELRVLQSSAIFNFEKPQSMGDVQFIAFCPIEPIGPLKNLIDILTIIDENSLGRGWPSEGDWRNKLPEWFTNSFTTPLTQDQAEQWLAQWSMLSPEEQQRAEIEKDWSLDNWLYWMEPENRQWFISDLKLLRDRSSILINASVECRPFPWGALRCLTKACGASRLETEE